MNMLQEAWSAFRTNLIGVLTTINWIDLIDILVVAFIVYQLMRLVRETRALQLLKGIGAILALFLVAQILGMTMLQFFIQNILSWGIVVVVVLFQPELRRALEQMGRTKIAGIAGGGSGSSETEQMIATVCSAATYLSSHKIGALMVIEREIKLGEIIKTGTTVDAVPSLEMIANIFFPNSPLHDGALVIRGGRLHAAGCFLPLSNNMEIGRELGTRHRAALGMSEVSDALVVVVSEETGAISVAIDSRLQRKLSDKNLEKLMRAKLVPHEEEKPSRIPFWKKRKPQ